MYELYKKILNSKYLIKPSLLPFINLVLRDDFVLLTVKFNSIELCICDIFEFIYFGNYLDLHIYKYRFIMYINIFNIYFV